MRNVLMAVISGMAIAVWGDTYTWTGGVSSDFSTAGNWSGGNAPTSSESTRLIIPSGNRTITGLSGKWTVGAIELQGGTTELQFGSDGGTLDVKGVISGSGGLTVTGSTKAECQLKLEGANTFSGGFFCNGGRALLYNNSSLGTGAARFKSDGKTGHPLYLYGATQIANDITLGDEVSAADGSIWLAASKGNVKFTGSFTFTNKGECHNSSGNSNYRIRTNGNKITFAGAVNIVGGTVLPAVNSGTANLRFEKKILGAGTITFNGGGSLEIAGSQNELAKISCNKWESGDVTCSILADNAFSGGTIFNVVNNAGKTGTKTLALNGHDVTLGELSTTNDKVANLNPVVTSSAPATLTVLNATADHSYGGAIEGMASLAYESAGRTLTLFAGNSTTAGKLIVKAGTVIVDDGAAFPNLNEVQVASGATLQFTSNAGALGVAAIRVSADGKLNLGGRRLEVSRLYVDGKMKGKGSYTVGSDCPWLQGAGSEIIVTDETPVTGYVWTGAAGGNWNEPGNWLKDGEVATAAPGATDSLYIGAATESAPFRISKDTDISNPIVLGAGRQVFYVAHKNGTLTLRGVISGAGGIDFKSVRNDGYLSISAENTFAGGLCRKGPGQVKLWTKNGLGTGPFTVENPAGVEVSAPLNIIAEGVTIANDMTFLAEGQNDNKYNGAMLVSRSNVRLSGKITFAGDTRINFAEGRSGLYFDGETTVNGRLTLNSPADVYFTKAVKSTTGTGYLHTDQGRGRWHLLESGNALAYVSMSGAGTDAKVVCAAENVFPAAAYYKVGATTEHAYTLDLGGYDQMLAYCYDSGSCPATHYATSATTATLTLTPAEDRFSRLTFIGEASLELRAAAGTTFTLSGGDHTTRGSFRVTSGTLKLSDGAKATGLESVEIAAGAKFILDATADQVVATELNLADGAQLEVGADRTLICDTLVVKGVSFAAGTYQNVAWFSGAGSVKVITGSIGDAYVWTGAAGGEWNVAGNWTVNGSTATIAPSADKTLYIGAATPEHPFTVTRATILANPIILGLGQQYVQIGFGDGAFELTGKISGVGGIRFDSINNSQYVVQLKGTENDFVGGVRRSGAGQIRVFAGNALGTGVVTLDDGSYKVNGVGPDNLSPLYVENDCTLSNDFVIGGESFVNWTGWWGGRKGVTVRFAGTVKFWMPTLNTYQTRFNAASTIHFDGPVVLGGEWQNAALLCKAGATAYFHQRILAQGDPRRLYADNGDFTGYLCASSNQLSGVLCNEIGNWKWYLQAEDALADVPVFLRKEPTTSGAGLLLDLGGYDQHIGDIYYDVTTNPDQKPVSDKFLVTSDTACTLTVNATADRLFGGRFAGPISLVYAPKGDYAYTLSKAEHALTGTVTVARGTLKLVDGARFTQNAAVTVNGGTLELAAPQSIRRRTELRLQSGTLKLDAGTTTVANLYLGDSTERQAAGLWGAPSNEAAQFHDARIAGEGLLKVLRYDGGTAIIIR